MKTLVIIPAYNEAENIVRVMENLVRNYPQFDCIVVNDGSTDATAEICRRNGYNLLDLPINLGLAGAFRAGMKYAEQQGYDAAIQFDGDGQHRPEYIQPMLDRLREGNDIVIGSRFVTAKKPFTLRMMGSFLISFAIWVTTHKTIKDPTSGLRMYDRRMIHEFASQINHPPEPDTISYLVRRGASIAEVQVLMDERIAGESYLNLQRSIAYMLRMGISIMLVQRFRGGAQFLPKTLSSEEEKVCQLN